MKHIIIPLFAILVFIPPRAEAHAFPEHSDPRVGNTVKTSPPEVKIWFTEKVEPAFSGITVTAPSGQEIDKRDTHIGSGDASLLVVSLPPLQPGWYKVHWHVVSVDTHKTQGDFKFQFAP